MQIRLGTKLKHGDLTGEVKCFEWRSGIWANGADKGRPANCRCALVEWSNGLKIWTEVDSLGLLVDRGQLELEVKD